MDPSVALTAGVVATIGAAIYEAWRRRWRVVLIVLPATFALAWSVEIAWALFVAPREPDWRFLLLLVVFVPAGLIFGPWWPQGGSRLGLLLTWPFIWDQLTVWQGGFLGVARSPSAASLALAAVVVACTLVAAEMGSRLGRARPATQARADGQRPGGSWPIVESLPHPVRWLLLIPAAMVATYVVHIVMFIVFNVSNGGLVSDDSFKGWAFGLVDSVVTGYVPVATAALMAPRRKLVAAVAVGALGTLGLLRAFASGGDNFSALLVVEALFSLGGGPFACYQAWMSQRVRLVSALV